MTWDVPEFGAFEYTNDAIDADPGRRRVAHRLVEPRDPPCPPRGRPAARHRRGLRRSRADPRPRRRGARLARLCCRRRRHALRGGGRRRDGRRDRGGDRGRSRNAHEGDRGRGAGRRRPGDHPSRGGLRPGRDRAPGGARASSSPGRETPLTPTRDFARALLGTVGPATAEQVKKSDGELDADDIVGQSGLSAAFDEQLAGKPERSVVIRNAEGEAVETLETHEAKPGEPLETTLSAEVQTAAEEAFADVEGAAALVALDPKTGDILAVANRPTDEGANIAFTGQYPPGSTFKVISTAALLDTGLDTTEIVDCPESIKVGGREFVNFEGSAAGAVPFSTDFAQSCNTAFVSLADELEPHGASRQGRAVRRRHRPRAAARRVRGRHPARQGRGRGGGLGDRPGPDPGQPACDGGRRGDGPERRVAPAAPCRRRPRGGRRADRRPRTRTSCER